jgi:hypothetical protein
MHKASFEKVIEMKSEGIVEYCVLCKSFGPVATPATFSTDLK